MSYEDFIRPVTRGVVSQFVTATAVAFNPGLETANVTMLGRRPTLDQVANVAVFLASDWAGSMTATEVTITAGAVVDGWPGEDTP